MNRSCRAVPQRTNPPSCGSRHSQAIRARSSSCWARAHPGVRRHLERAELEQAEPSGRPVGRVQLVDADLGPVGVAGHVDEDVTEQPVDEPERDLRRPGGGDLGEGDLEFVEAVVAGLVHPRRLAGRADVEALRTGRTATGGAASTGTRLLSRSGRRRNGESAGVAPPRTTWLPPPVPVWRPSVMILLGAEPGLAGRRRRAGGDLDRLAPGLGRVDVDLDHPGIGSDP